MAAADKIKPGTGKSDKNGGGGGEGQPDLTKLLAGIDSLTKSVADANVNSQASIREMLQQNQRLMQEFADSKQATTKEPVVPEIDAEALEHMSRAELMALQRDETAAMVKRVLQETIKPQIDALQQGIQGVDVAHMVTAMSGKHADFGDWLPEINELAGKVKGLDPEGLYTLVRAQNPEKIKELDTKYKVETKAEDNFGGLTPGGTPQRVEKTDMSESEASSTAWNETVGSLGTEDQQKLLRIEEPT